METRTDPGERRRGPGYERRDARAGSVIYFAIGLLVTLGAILVSMRFVFDFFASTQSLGPPATPFEDVRQLPPQPRLQPEPRRDLSELRASEDSILNSYAWVDQKAGIVRIPVERALELSIQKGLPVRTSSSTPESNQPPAGPWPQTHRQRKETPNGADQ